MNEAEMDRYIDDVQQSDDEFEFCGALHESYDETGMRCELKPGHTGQHLAWIPVTWPIERNMA